MRMLLTTILLLAITGSLRGQTPLSRERAIEMFLERNVEVQAARYQIDRARAEQIAARLRPNPTVTVTLENFALSGPAPFGQLYEVGATYSDIIERGGKRQLRSGVADLALSVAEATFQDVLRQKLAEVKRAFLGALLAHHRVEIAAASSGTVEELLFLNTVRFENGAVAEGDVLKVRLEKVRADSALRQARLEESHAMIALLEKLEEPELGLRPLAGTLEGPPVTLNLETLRALALNNRPDLRASAAQIELNEKRLNLERARAATDIAPFIGYKRNGPNNTVTFGFTMTLPARNHNEGGIARAAAERSVAEGEREVALNHVVVEVESAFRSYEASSDQVTMFRDQLLLQADDAQKIALAAYEEGATGLLPVLEAQQTRTEIQQEYFQKLFEYQASLLDLELAVGGPIQP
ncbi:MAG TPA: TolC family protein [Terriglobia bacterium]|nr:TolC family protein [Terriglobia bacterium]